MPVRLAAVDRDQRRAGGVHRHRARGVAVRGAHEPLQYPQDPIAATTCARGAIATRPSSRCCTSRAPRCWSIELQGALFFGTAERLAQFVDGETAQGTKALLLELRRVTEIDFTGARILGDIDAALAARGVKLALVLSGRTETAARLADIFHAPDR